MQEIAGMKKCKFTIITVCYNAESSIAGTVKSVQEQTCEDYEYIIKDGNSTDKTVEIVRNLTADDSRTVLLQGQDKGIYDAMNIAVSSAAGDYILFLNAGDEFANENVLQQVYQSIENDDHDNADILYGNVIELEEGQEHLRIYTAKNSKLWYYSLGACLCHQGMFCKRELFPKRRFDLDYKVCADREWQMYLIRNGATARPLNLTVARVLADGFSKEHVTDLEKETRECIKCYCGIGYMLYMIICKLKVNKNLHKVMQKIENIISYK